MVAMCDELAILAEQSPGSLEPRLAIEIGAEAEKHFPKDFEVLLATGRLYLASGELHRALKPLIEAARIASEPRALRFLGEVFLRLGDARHAAMSFERAIKRGATDPETKAWHESARGYMPVQEQHGAAHVAGLVESAKQNVGADDDDDEGSLPRFRTPFPSDAELPDLSDGEDEPTDVLTMSRVVAAIQQSPAGTRGDFVGMLEVARKRFDTSTDGARTILKKNDGDSDSGPVDFDLDRDGLSHEIFDADGPTPGGDEPTQELRPRSEPPSTALNAATSRLANAASPRPGLRGASSAPPPAVATVPLPSTPPAKPPPAGPVSATSDRIIPVDLGGGSAQPASEPAPEAKKPAAAEGSAAKPAKAPAKSPSLVPAAGRKRKSGLGVGLIAVGTTVLLLGGSVVAVRLGALPQLAEQLPPWVSGQSPAPAPEPPAPAVDEPEPVDEPDEPDEEPTAEPAGSEDEDAAPEPSASASAEATASAEASADEPPPPPPKTASTPNEKPPPKPVAKKPPPKEPPPKDPPPKEPPPSGEAPDVVWLGDPELQ